MLNLTTKRTDYIFTVDGKAHTIPLELTDDEMTALLEAYDDAGLGMVKGDDGSYGVDTSALSMSKSTQSEKWFRAFVKNYVGDVAEKLSYDSMNALFKDWQERRNAAQEPDMGESSALPES